MVPFNGGVESMGYEKNHNFQPKSRFISEMMQDTPHGRRIGNCTQAFEWYHSLNDLE